MFGKNIDTISNILHYLGLLLIQLSFCLSIPLVFVFLDKEYLVNSSSLTGFLLPSLLSLCLGFFLFSRFKTKRFSPSTAFLICGVVWIVFSLFGGIPFLFSANVSFIDAFFEGTSGFTTTGTSILADLTVFPRSLLFWRSFMQWIGGIGMITFFLVIGSGSLNSHKLYGTESAKMSFARPVPGMFNTIRILCIVYVVGTVLVIATLYILGVPFFQSLNHGLTCVSTGGFSTFNNNIKGFETIGYKNFKLIEYTLIAGMVFGGTNFLLHFKMITGQWKSIFSNSEVKVWLLAIILFTSSIILMNYYFPSKLTGLKFETVFRQSLFQITALATTAGYSINSFRFALFGPAIQLIFIFLMFTGGCHGSTTGGVKTQRIIIIGKAIKREIQKLWTPKGTVLPLILDKKILQEDAIYQALIISATWVILIAVGTFLLLILSKFTLSTAFSAMLSATSNIGPSLLSTKDLILASSQCKLILIVGMIAGRIEILPLILLFNRKAWN
ncbi:MAG: TrkH family potassium uptake protein [Caldisericia bacterium]|nr:TrkH family potassium uptake protein [Caldisericia bacterium]